MTREPQAFPSVAVVIPSRNRSNLLMRCVRAALADNATTQVVVVLDGCSDDSELELQSLSDARLQTLVFNENKGRSVARQAGIEATLCQVVLLVDDDVILSEATVSGHAAHHAHDTNNVVVGYMPVNEAYGVGDSLTRAISDLYSFEYNNVVDRYLADSNTVLTNLWGGNVSLHRDKCLRVGLVSEGFENTYHEDTDFGLRCAAVGLHGVFDLALTASHHHQRHLDGFLNDAYSQGVGQELLAARHGSKPVKATRVSRLLTLPFARLLVRALSPVVARLVPASRVPLLKLMRRQHAAAGAQSARQVSQST